MRSIVITDYLYHRYIGLNHAFSSVFELSPAVDVFDTYNAKKIIRKGCYRNALVIGNQTEDEIEKINQLLLRNNENIIIYRIIFSDAIKLSKLKRHLILSPFCIVVSGDILPEELIDLSKSWFSNLDEDSYVTVKFNRNEQRLFRRWEYEALGNSLLNNDINDAEYTVSSRLKRKVNIRSEYSIYLLWRIAREGYFYLNNYTRRVNGKTCYPKGDVSVGLESIHA